MTKLERAGKAVVNRDLDGLREYKESKKRIGSLKQLEKRVMSLEEQLKEVVEWFNASK